MLIMDVEEFTEHRICYLIVAYVILFHSLADAGAVFLSFPLQLRRL